MSSSSHNLPPGHTLTVTFAVGTDGWTIRPVHAEARDSANGRHIASRQLHDQENGRDAYWGDPRPEEQQEYEPEQWPTWAKEILADLELATTDQMTRQDA